MRCSMIAGVVAVLALNASVLCPPVLGGDLKFKMIRPCEQGAGPPRTAGTNERHQCMEVELSPDTGVDALNAMNCPALARLYKDLSDAGSAGEQARAVAGKIEGDLIVYLVCDNNGLTGPMQQEYGLCPYDDPDDKTASKFAWLCGHRTPERAVKIGEHFAQAFLKEMGRFGSLEGDGDEQVRKALAAAVLGEMTSAVGSYLFQEKTEILLSDKTVFKVPGCCLLMPTARSSQYRMLDLYTAVANSPLLLSVYERAALDVMPLFIKKGTPAQTALKSAPDLARQDLPECVGYYMTNLPLSNLVQNEVFGALVLHHFLATQPPDPASPAGALACTYRVVDHFTDRIELGTDLISILDQAMASFERSVHGDEGLIRDRCLYLVGLMDLFSNFSSTRESFETVLEFVVAPSATQGLRAALDSYLYAVDGASARDLLKEAWNSSRNLNEMVEALRQGCGQTVCGLLLEPPPPPSGGGSAGQDAGIAQAPAAVQEKGPAKVAGNQSPQPALAPQKPHEPAVPKPSAEGVARKGLKRVLIEILQKKTPTGELAKQLGAGTAALTASMLELIYVHFKSTYEAVQNLQSARDIGVIETMMLSIMKMLDSGRQPAEEAEKERIQARLMLQEMIARANKDKQYRYALSRWFHYSSNDYAPCGKYKALYSHARVEMQQIKRLAGLYSPLRPACGK